MKKFTVILLGLFFMVSCDNFLTEDPKTQIFVDTYFDKPEDARAMTNAMYRTGVPGFWGSGGVYSGTTGMMGGYMSGLFDNEYKGQERHVQYMHNLDLDSVNMADYFGGQWSGAYQAISRANSVIKYVPDTEGLSESESNNLLAQARFFRAYNYFYLVRVFGDVPLVLEPYESLDDIYVSRTPSSEIYSQIIEDLNWAIQNGGLNDAPFAQNGYRITRGAAQTVLADAHLHRAGYPLQQEEAYAEAADVARSIINSGIYSLIEHGATPEQSAYNTLRTSDNESEYIYTYEYVSNISENSLPTYAYPVRLATLDLFTYSITNNAYEPVDELIRVYDSEKDLRIQEQQFFHTERVIDGELYEFSRAPYLYHNTQALFETNRGDKDVNLYRFAEVLLMGAEAIAQTEGVTSEAVSYLAEVRSRAYWETDRSEIEAELLSLSVQDFVEEVWTERLREFSLEFKIWFDIQRTRAFPVTTEGNEGVVNYANVIGHTNQWGRTFQEHHLLFPISNTEIQRNPELEQNPGYLEN